MNIFNVCGDTNFQLIYCIQKYATWATKINCYEHLVIIVRRRAVLHFQTCLDELPSLSSIQESCD
ncbi:hypothetical protein T10_12995 [Trichinella papuae]|uniref:Uncharacterized protein n=1 Tax=Trichinella papuae TaxID=268474 RepID=A0A0V1MQ78_9BILA|nr:hypothetical protein T10_12995 [Trichinella papuae]